MFELSDATLGPLGLNKVITFEVLYQSLQIEPTVTLFRVLQRLCKQGDWFSIAKHHAPSLVYIDDNRSCIKHWKSGFFSFNQRDIPGSMVLRHPSAAIDDPRSVVGSLRGAHLDATSTLQRLPFYYTPPSVTDVVIPDPTLEDLAIGTPSSKILGKADASQKRKASTSGATSSHGKGIMADDVAVPFVGVNRSRSSSRNVPSFMDVSEDVIHEDFFCFSNGPYHATYPEGGVAGNYEFTREQWDAPY
nr:hypothetical protein [Tanacetum cinerariifolium]